MDQVVAEHFHLSMANKVYIDQVLSKIHERLRPDATVRLFVGVQNHRVFTALFRVRLRGKDLVAHHSSTDFHLSINRARAHLLRRMNREAHE